MTKLKKTPSCKCTYGCSSVFLYTKKGAYLLVCIQLSKRRGTAGFMAAKNQLAKAQASGRTGRGSHREAASPLRRRGIAACSPLAPGSGSLGCRSPAEREHPRTENSTGGYLEADAFVPTLNNSESICIKVIPVLLVIQDWSGLFFFFSIIYLYSEQPRYNNKEGYNEQTNILCAYERASLFIRS